MNNRSSDASDDTGDSKLVTAAISSPVTQLEFLNNRIKELESQNARLLALISNCPCLKGKQNRQALESLGLEEGQFSKQTILIPVPGMCYLLIWIIVCAFLVASSLLCLADKLNVRKKRRRTTSLSSFPDELLQEILCKLPVRVLTRFKRVCTLWGDLISSQHFISMHIKKYETETSVILVNSISRSEPVIAARASISLVYPPSTPPNAINSVDFTLPDGFPQMTSACNGIICLWDTVKPDHIALWNPANKDLKMIPESKLPRQFKPKSTRSMVLFGYDDARNDYKIMRVLIGDVRCRCLEFELYSLNSGLWKKLDFSGLIRDPDEIFAQGIHSTGGKIVSWFVSHDKETRVEKRWEVVLFDMCSERYEIVQVPVEASVQRNLVLRPYEASIGVLDFHVRDQVWVLKDINSHPSGGLRSWKKVDTSKFTRLLYSFKVVGFWDEHMLFLDNKTSRLIMFDLGRSSYDVVGFCRYGWVHTANRYKESLVRLL